MIEKRLRLVFDAMRHHEVACLLMGGQACVLYGAAEFSKDVDFAVLARTTNFDRLHRALDQLRAKVIAVPPFDPELLAEGLAVHFRCQAPGVEGLRIDVMTRMRGVEEFSALWKRRFRVADNDGGVIHLLDARDLVAAKKTQRDKDWPMIQRLMEVRYLSGAESPTAEEVEFWLQELRTPELLIDVVKRFPQETVKIQAIRPLLKLALTHDRQGLSRALTDEMLAEQEQDRIYWEPLKARLAELRRAAKAA